MKMPQGGKRGYKDTHPRLHIDILLHIRAREAGGVVRIVLEWERKRQKDKGRGEKREEGDI
jgi:hypothetical protein